MNSPKILLSPLLIGSCRLSNRLIAAPMAGITDLPFRTILKSYGTGLTFSEMISAEAYIRGHQRTRGILERAEGEVPFGVQLFGGKPASVAEAARRLEREHRCDLIDLNLGCPVKKVMRSGSGAALLRDDKRLIEMVDRVVQAVSLPVTVKMRAGVTATDRKGVDLIPELFARGVRAVFLHARCVAWNFSHPPHWEWIRQATGQGGPIVGNGGIFIPGDAMDMVLKTGCDGVMIARGMLGAPWIFRQVAEQIRGEKDSPPSLEERMDTMKRHLSLSIRVYGEKQGILKMRKHLAWYVRGLPYASVFRDRINHLECAGPLYDEIRRYQERIKEREESLDIRVTHG